MGDPVGGAWIRHRGSDRLRGSLGAIADRRQRGADRHDSATAAVHGGSEDCRGLRWARRVLRRRFNPLADCGRRSRDLSRSDHLRGAGVPDCVVCHAGGARPNAPAVTIDVLVAQHFCKPTARLLAAPQSAVDSERPAPPAFWLQTKKPAPITKRAFELLPAATYSPTHLRTQYHRRWQA